jgi:hypothetical protein
MHKALIIHLAKPGVLTSTLEITNLTSNYPDVVNALKKNNIWIGEK